jgi:hypothetical protein
MLYRTRATIFPCRQQKAPENQKLDATHRENLIVNATSADGA